MDSFRKRIPPSLPSDQAAEAAFGELVRILRALRTPETGCPWDLEQTHETLRSCLLEESYEVLDAIDKGSDRELAEELGDLLLQVVFHAQIGSDREAFSITEIINGLSEKMLRRHPHVFGDLAASNAAEVLSNWEKIKAEEKKLTENKLKENELNKTSSPVAHASPLSGVPRSAPALLKAEILGEKATRFNFDWNSLRGVTEKLFEEWEELQVELAQVDGNPDELLEKRIKHELGDVLFSLAQVGRWLGISAEESLQQGCSRFANRVNTMAMLASKPLSDSSTGELQELWKQAKEAEIIEKR